MVTLEGMTKHPDHHFDRDPEETAEWLESLEAVLSLGGPERAGYLLERLSQRADALGLVLPGGVNTPYVNTVAVADEPVYPGDEALEKRIRAIIRWNAVAMVDRANLRHEGLGGHLSSFASAASLYDVGFHHFFRGGEQADQVFIQGHAAPGIYSRAFLEGRLSTADLDRFRRETAGGLSSYPHPRRMPSFWQFPTVSMGLGTMNAVHQARMNRYLEAQGVIEAGASRVWSFAGDGEMDEPEATASLALAAREGLDNLTMVVNCNLQRLDGPVRGNGKIIQELEGVFRGAGWNVIKVIWGGAWDPLLSSDDHGLLVARMGETVDGDYQRYSISDGAHIREHFFGSDPRLAAMVSHLSDDALYRLPRGGHDVRKVHAAFAQATTLTGAPTVVLVKTVKGWALGDTVEARNSAHQVKKLSIAELRLMRDRLELPIPDAALGEYEPEYFHPGESSPEVAYLREHRARLGGPLPTRRNTPHTPLPAVSPDVFSELEGGSGALESSTTSAMARLTRGLMRDPALGRRVVPIVADEARTFGLDALFASHGIYAPGGQHYEPVDAKLALSYKEATNGRLLQEGISEAAALCDFTALATSHSTWGEPVIPMFFYYSMFGFQRVGDLIWNACDQRARGFLLGATAGRTTLAGEGLQHCDGHSLLMASTVPSVRNYDCAYAYEIAAVVRAGLAAMTDEDVVYYLTLYNETYAQPAAPEGAASGIIRGAHRILAADGEPQVRILASGPLVNSAIAAREALGRRGVAAEVWSVTSYTELRREALACERWNRLHPTETAQVAYVTELFGTKIPIVAVSDWMRAVPEQISRFVAPMQVLGTDGWGLSDTRTAMRDHFEIDWRHITVAGLTAAGVGPARRAEAITKLGVNPDAPDPGSEEIPVALRK